MDVTIGQAVLILIFFLGTVAFFLRLGIGAVFFIVLIVNAMLLAIYATAPSNKFENLSKAPVNRQLTLTWTEYKTKLSPAVSALSCIWGYSGYQCQRTDAKGQKEAFKKEYWDGLQEVYFPISAEGRKAEFSFRINQSPVAVQFLINSPEALSIEQAARDMATVVEVVNQYIKMETVASNNKANWR